jgi:hypothetical protein
MNKSLGILKGLHPAIVLDRELKKRGLAKGIFYDAAGFLRNKRT